MGRCAWKIVCRGRDEEVLGIISTLFGDVWYRIMCYSKLIGWELLYVPKYQFKFYFMYSNFLLNMVF